MALHVNPAPELWLGENDLAAWRAVPVAVAGDELNRTQIMSAAIKPVAPGMGFAGLALTVGIMVGDNAPMHYALADAWPGAVMVVDAQGYEDTAVWGGIMHHAAERRGLGAVVFDGAMRDVAELRESRLPAFCRAIVPAGPHKGFGGVINGPIQCAGVPVNPGDLVLGDDDGVIVIRPDQMDGLMARCRARMAMEEEVMAGIDAGKTTVELLGLPPAEEIGK
jgi:4-hydroxy-4-methyl-2-oxoglutarate aldolase